MNRNRRRNPIASELLGNRLYRHRAEKTKKVRLREQEDNEAKNEIKDYKART